MQNESTGRGHAPSDNLHFAFFILHLDGPRSSDRSERRSAKAEVAGAIPAVDTISQDCGVTSSISPCEGDGPGANPGFLTILWPWPKITGSEVQAA